MKYKNYLIYLILLSISIISIINIGYSYSEPYYLPLMQYYNDNTLYSQDLHISLLSTTPLYFWKSISYFTDNNDLEWVMFSLFVLAKILLSFSIYFLALTLFKNKIVALLSTIFSVLIVWTFNIGHFLMINKWMSPYIFSLPFAFFSISYFIKKKYLTALLLLAAIVYIHPLSAFYLGFMYIIYFLFNLKEINKKLMVKGLISLAIVSPVLIKSISIVSSKISNLDLWMQFIILRSGHHIFPSFWDFRSAILFFILVIFFFISWKYRPIKKIHKPVLFMGLATLILMTTGAIFSEIYFNLEIVKLSLFRSIIYFRVIMIIYISNYIYNSLRKGVKSHEK